MFYLEKYQENPYKLFFSFGFLMAILGILPWALLLFHWQGYPLIYHRMVMIGGFLTSFVAGFLMTAVPRFTQSTYPSVSEICVSIVSLIAGYLCAVMQIESLFYLSVLICHGNIFCFAIRRFKKRKSNPPPTFVFIGWGLISWILADSFLFANALGVFQSPQWYLLFKNIWIEGAILSLILGVGGRLIAAIFGWTDVIRPQEYINDRPISYFKVIPRDLLLSVFLFYTSFFIEAFFNSEMGLSLRGLVILYFSIKFWRIYRFPIKKSWLTWGIWSSIWCILIGNVTRLLWAAGGTHALHILFVGGFGLLTVIIATRVTLAHSSVGTAMEKTSKSLFVVTLLILLAALTRVAAIMSPKIYLDHLGYAAILWVLAITIWLIKFGKVMLLK